MSGRSSRLITNLPYPDAPSKQGIYWVKFANDYVNKSPDWSIIAWNGHSISFLGDEQTIEWPGNRSCYVCTLGPRVDEPNPKDDHMRHIITYDEQSLLDLANVDPTRFKEVIRVMIKSLPIKVVEEKEDETSDTTSTSVSTFPTPTSSTPTFTFTHHNSFRLLNDNELHILLVKGGIAYPESDRGTWLWQIEWERLQVSYEELSGGFIVCLITYSPTIMTTKLSSSTTTFLWQGVSRRSIYDKPNRIKGEVYAFIRAITKSRPVEI